MLFFFFLVCSGMVVEADVIEQQRGRRGLPQEAGGHLMLTFSQLWG